MTKTLPGLFSLIAVAGFVAAGRAPDVTGPEGFLAIMTESKVHYSFGSKPVDKPARGLECEKRTSLQRARVVDGRVSGLEPWGTTKEAFPHFESAESLMKERKFEAAAVEYDKGLALDPAYGPGWLFSGDAFFMRNLSEEALARYRHALDLDPTLAQAHRFAADVLVRLNRFDEARDEYVAALVNDPSYSEALDALTELGKRAGFGVARHPFDPPKNALSEFRDGKISIGVPNLDKGPGWAGYFLCKAVWQAEPSYRMKRLKLAREEPYSWTNTEENECVANYGIAEFNATESRLEKANGGKKPASSEVDAALPEDIRFIMGLGDNHMFEGFMFFEDAGRRCPRMILTLPAEVRKDMEGYIRRFVIRETTK